MDRATAIQDLRMELNKETESLTRTQWNEDGIETPNNLILTKKNLKKSHTCRVNQAKDRISVLGNKVED